MISDIIYGKKDKSSLKFRHLSECYDQFVCYCSGHGSLTVVMHPSWALFYERESLMDYWLKSDCAQKSRQDLYSEHAEQARSSIGSYNLVRYLNLEDSKLTSNQEEGNPMLLLLPNRYSYRQQNWKYPESYTNYMSSICQSSAIITTSALNTGYLDYSGSSLIFDLVLESGIKEIHYMGGIVSKCLKSGMDEMRHLMAIPASIPIYLHTSLCLAPRIQVGEQLRSKGIKLSGAIMESEGGIESMFDQDTAVNRLIDEVTRSMLLRDAIQFENIQVI